MTFPSPGGLGPPWNSKSGSNGTCQRVKLLDYSFVYYSSLETEKYLNTSQYASSPLFLTSNAYPMLEFEMSSSLVNLSIILNVQQTSLLMLIYSKYDCNVFARLHCV
ncbi:hypothetical protein VTL71DRAFT_5297 [Oculimacula yallundae]|uniref:Uncharacterized protein n=1 Tax=Oculimacula yallundae TaxID=86028 RepID=A0ABR4C1C0_9HELO